MLRPSRHDVQFLDKRTLVMWCPILRPSARARDDRLVAGDAEDSDDVEDAEAAEVTTTPSAADWDAAIEQYQFFRRLEKQDATRSAGELPLVLSKIANEIYDIANELGRTNRITADLAKHSRDKIAERVALYGWASEVKRRLVPFDFLDRLPAQLEASAPELRRCADLIKNGAERAQSLVAQYEECVEKLRGSSTTGRLPSASMFSLISQTDRWKSSIGQIARQLLQRGVQPESKSVDPNLRRVWEMLLKKGRGRARKRTIDEGSS
jgi:hypothetical protein